VNGAENDQGTEGGQPFPAPIEAYRSLVENAVEGIYRTTPDGRYLTANPALARIYGYASPAEMIRNLTDIARDLYIDPSARDRFKRALAAEAVVRNFEAQVRRKDDSVIWISENARAVRDSAGRILFYEGTVQDISERKRAEDSLRLAATVFENVGEAIVVTDAARVVRAVNTAFQRMTGWSAEEVLGQPCQVFTPAITGEATIEEAWSMAMAGESWKGELWAARSDGEAFPVAVALTGVPGGNDESGDVGHFVLLLRDITRSKSDELRIRFHASHDALTRLANRHTVMERLAAAIGRAEAGGHRLALLFLDVNRFKDVNDSFGHAAGDDLLRQVARRMKSCVRADDLIGRLGGDEFVVILPAVPNAAAAMTCVTKLLYAFSDPFALAGTEFFSSTSIGIALYPDDADTPELLLSRADAAMYHAKRNGRPYRFYDVEMDQQAIERLSLENDLRRALTEGQFRLAYQPKVSYPDRAPIGAEALIRWRHAERGMVPPSLFIPVAERAGLIGTIGDWALDQACRQMGEWRKRGFNLPSVSVNLSPIQFHDPRLTAKVAAALDAHALPAAALELEITETMMATEVDRAIAILDELCALGVKVSVDDFGTGYSSLAYLKLFPVSALKIDRAFVRELPDNAKDAAIVASVVALAGNLGFEVIAEGVESQGQADLLLSKGCRFMQGHLFCPALPADDFERRLRAWPPARPSAAG
jgi:diguanylate cyclase (GGDEF)-like protein/PAS domain S-box-containing protein